MATAARSFGPPQPAIAARRGGRSGPRKLPTRVILAALDTVLLVAASIVAAPPIVGIAGEGTPPIAAALRLPVGYVALAPVSDVLDALTLLTPGQHLAIFLWAIAGFVGWRTRRIHDRRRTGLGLRTLREAAALGWFLAAYASVYAAGLLAPRPMAALALDDRDALAIDVHSHTEVSHDGRTGFGPEANRRWHAAAGFAAAYVTDHRGYMGAELGALGNPAHAGDGTMVLPGIESAVRGAHVMLLGARAPMLLDHEGTLDLERLRATRGIVTVLAFPARLRSLPADLPLTAIEGSDGAPRGLRDTRRHVEQIRDYATAHRLVRVAGSNNHGWGRTAPAWTVLRMPGWRAMSGEALDSAIRATLLRGGPVAVLVRATVAPPRSDAEWLATPFLVAWDADRRLSTMERVAWLAWIWTIVALLPRRRRAPLPNASASAERGRRSPARVRSAPPPGTSAPTDRCAAP